MSSITVRGFFAATLAASLTAPSYAQEARVDLVSSIRADAEGQFASVRNGPTSIPVLRRTIAVDLDRASLEAALVDITRSAGIELTYSKELLPDKGRVTLQASGISVGDALDQVLRGTGLNVLVSEEPKAVLVRRPEPPAEPTPAEPPVGTIVGRVTDAETGNPLVNAQIAVDGRGRTITDADGRYRIEAIPAGSHTVSVTLIGYASVTEEVDVADGATVTVDFALEVAPSTLDELVVTATGPQRRVEVGHAVAVIRADSTVATAPIRDLGDLVAGRAAGVQVVFPGGISGQAPRFRIRGVNSITISNDPIIVVDGVRVENTPGTRATMGRLADINPEEIESIEVIKGPSAATLYGTDAANGVVLIETKRGANEGAQWTVYSEYGVVEPPNTDWWTNYRSWGRDTSTGAQVQCLLTSIAAGACVQDSVTTFNPLRDSPSSPLGSGRRYQQGIQVAGSVSQLHYFVSAELENEVGYIETSDHDQEFFSNARLGGRDVPREQVRPNEVSKYSFRGNVQTTLGSTTELGLSTGIVRNDSRFPDFNSQDFFTGAAYGSGTADTLAQWWLGRRPVDQFARIRTEEVTRVTQSLTANWQPEPWLSLRGTFGVDLSNVNFSNLVRRGESLLDPEGSRIRDKMDIDLYTADVGATVTRHLGVDLQSRTAFGVQYNRRRARSAGVQAVGLLAGSETATGAASVTGFERTNESIVAGAYVEETLSLRDRLFLTGAIRFDGASSFGEDFRTAAYPKAGLSWLVLDQRGTPSSLPLGLSSLRLRLAFGASGVQPSPVAALTRARAFTGLVDGEPTNAAALATIGDPELKPERQTEIEAGFDAELADGRVSLELTGYQRESRDAIINLPSAPSFGLGEAGAQINVGKVRNRGLEALLSMRILADPRISLQLDLNGSVNENRLLRLAPDVPRLGNVIANVEGFPLFGLWERPILGFDDANGDGIVDFSEVQLGDTMVFQGPIHPTRQLGATTTLGLLNDRLRFAALLDYRGGHKRQNGTSRNRCFQTIFSCREMNDPTAPLDRQAAAVAFLSAGGFPGYIEKGDFVRLRELSATFSDAGLARLAKARSASLTVAARNVATWSGYSGIDVEGTDRPGGNVNPDNPTAPPARYFIVRVNLEY